MAVTWFLWFFAYLRIAEVSESTLGFWLSATAK